VARKRLLGLEPTARAPQTAYSPAVSEATYRELGRIAAHAGSAIVDATFRRRAERDAFREALGTAAPVFVECRVPADVVRRRAAERLRDPDRTSDATPDIAMRQQRDFEPLDEVAAGAHMTIRADQGFDLLVEEVADALDRAAGLPQR
jgi:predicted kinase